MAVMGSRRSTQEPFALDIGLGFNVMTIVVLVIALAVGAVGTLLTGNPASLIVAAVIGVLLMPSPRIAQQWERAIVLRFGRYVGLRGPGLFWMIIDGYSAGAGAYQITYTLN